MESEGEGGFLRARGWGIDRAPQVLNSPLVYREGTRNSQEKSLSTERESRFPSDGCSRNSTLDLDLYPIRSALGHSTRCLAEAGYLKWILSFVVDAEPAAPLTGGGRSTTWAPSFCCCQLLSGRAFLY
ncbi:hypothetical protein R6Q59_035764 [Mikania micrantha]